ncbi:MAG: hypothetical protein Q8Q35_00370 [Nanoarchaeota archaeon]|nr:hypothetical protein [Nanoarchaeota archaeon]
MRKIVIRITAEVIGAPKEHVEETLTKMLDALDKEEDINVLSRKTHETNRMEKNDKLWSTFAEVEFEANSFQRVLNICYDYMPSTIEIIEPAGMDIDTNDVNDFMNDFLSKLHKYAMVMKKLQSENIYMMKRLEMFEGKKS